jgi:hypothetical protein
MFPKYYAEIDNSSRNVVVMHTVGYSAAIESGLPFTTDVSGQSIVELDEDDVIAAGPSEGIIGNFRVNDAGKLESL